MASGNPGAVQTNQSFNLANGASQTLVVALQYSGSLAATDEHLVFQCSGSGAATSIIGVDTLLLSVSPTPQPDIIALVATPSADGTVRMVGVGQPQAFAVATVNLGATGTITVSADTGDVMLPIQITICQTNPSTGACLSGAASSVAVTIANNATPTFSVFTTAQSAIPFSPGITRLSVRFKDAGGATRGSTSVAITTGSTLTSGQTAGGYYLGTYRITSGPLLGQAGKGAFLVSEDGEVRGVSYDPLNGTTISSLFTAQAVPGSSLLYNGIGSIFAASGYTLYNGALTSPLVLSGAVSPHSFIGGAYSFTGESGAFLASYQSAVYERPSSFSAVSGGWTLRDLNGNSVGSLQVTSAGTFTGQDIAGCTYNGNLTIIDPRYNAYRINLTISNCTFGTGAYEGLGGLFDGRSKNDSFQFDLSSSSAIETNYITRY